MIDKYGLLLLVPALWTGASAVGLSELDERRRRFTITRRVCLVALIVQAATLVAVSRFDAVGVRPTGLGLAAVVAVGATVAAAVAVREALLSRATMLRHAVRPLLGALGGTGLGWALGLEVLPTAAVGLLGVGLASWVPGPSDAGLPMADVELTRHTRETLLALERLADPVALQRRVIGELGRLFPRAKLEVLRATDAPRDALQGAETVPASLVRAVASRGYVVRGRTESFSPEQRKRFDELDASLVVAVRGGYTLYGLLRIDHDNVDRAMVVTARRFADLLGLKLETHRLQQEVLTNQRLAELGTLASGLAHDLRTPLATIVMNLQMLQMRAPDLGPDAESVELALRAADRLNAYVGTLLDYARPIELDRGRFDILQLTHDALRQVDALRRERNVTIDVQSADELPEVTGDPMRLSRVIVNLVENALKASGPNTAMEIAILHHPSGVQIVVRDQGHGIAPDDLPRLFDPFFTTRQDGVGLGLAMCKKIVEAHHGTISARNRGIGAEFRIELPVRA